MGIPLRTGDLGAVTRAGWQCPECRTVWSPDVRQCDCAAVKLLAERMAVPAPVTSGGSCTCTPSGLGTARCPVHQGPLPGATTPVCTCPAVWGGPCPPPACPVHGQTEMLQVTC